MISTKWYCGAFRSFGSASIIERPAILVGAQHIQIGAGVIIWRGARIEAFGRPGEVAITIGNGTVIQPGAHIGAVNEVRIGNECLFASGIYVTDHDHDLTNPELPPVSNSKVCAAPTVIEDRVWLGERAMVLKGCRVGRSSVVGAGSIVTESIPPFSIAAGAPARVIKRWDPDAREWIRA
ncbi:MAG: acyltransferase [Phycisphaerales bacterium]